MFEKNISTFNPSWHKNGKNNTQFDDVSEIQRQLKSKGITFTPAADKNTAEPASFNITYPDGNVVLFDQPR